MKFKKMEKLLNSFKSGVVSAETAYRNDPNLLRPADDAFTDNRGYSHTRFGPVFSAVRLMSETMARAPLYVGKLDEDNPASQGVYNKEHELNNHDSILNRPNPFMTAQTFWESFFTTLLVTGNVYCVIRRYQENGYPVSLHFAERAHYEITQSKDEMGRVIRRPRYRMNVYNEDGRRTFEVNVPASDVLAVHGPGYNVKTAKSPSPLTHAIQRSLRMYDSTLGYQHKSLEKGLGAKGIVTVKGDDYTPEQIQEISTKIKEIIGLTLGQPWQVFPSSVDVKPLDNEAVDQSIFNALNFSVEEICRIYNIPAPLLGAQNPAGLGQGAEIMNNLFINNSLMPYAQRLEQAIFQKIMTSVDRNDGYVCRLDLSSLAGGTLTNKIQNAERLVKSMLTTPNEARQMILGLGPVEGGDQLMPFAGAAPGQNRDEEERREEGRQEEPE